MRRSGVDPTVEDLQIGLWYEEVPGLLPSSRAPGPNVYCLERVLLADKEPVALDKNPAVQETRRFVATETEGTLCCLVTGRGQDQNRPHQLRHRELHRDGPASQFTECHNRISFADHQIYAHRFEREADIGWSNDVARRPIHLSVLRSASDEVNSGQINTCKAASPGPERLILKE